MNLNFGDVASALGNAGSGILGGMRTSQVENQKLAMQKALQNAQIANMQSEETYRASEEQHVRDADDQQTQLFKRHLAMAPSLVKQINQYRGLLEENPMEDGNYEQYAPDYLNQELQRVTSANENRLGRKESENYRMTLQQDREHGQLLADLDRIEKLVGGPDGLMATHYFEQNPTSPITQHYSSTFKRAYGYDPFGVAEPQDDGTPGQGKAKPAARTASPDAPGKSVVTGYGPYGAPTTDQPTNQTTYGSYGAPPPANQIGTTVVPGSQGVAPPGAVMQSITDRQVVYANKLISEGIPRAIAIQRAKNEVH